MKRKEREITSRNEVINILKESKICRLGLCNNNIPYIVPLNYGYKNNCLYFHSAKEGMKINMIKQNPHVCFEIETAIKLLPNVNPCKFDMRYKSVIGFGKASIITDLTEKIAALDIIMSQYTNNKFEYNEKALSALVAIKMQISTMSGKKSGF